MIEFDPAEVTFGGKALIEASAGTGKTYTIGTLYLKLLMEERLKVREILVVTFTRAATAELRDRLRARIREQAQKATGAVREHLDTQLRCFDQAAIHTIHGFCQRALQDHAFESGFAYEVEFLEDQSELVKEVADYFWGRTFYEAELSALREALDASLSPDHLNKIVDRAVRTKGIEVLPAGLHEARDRWAAARQATSAIWSDHGEAILAWLGDAQLVGCRTEKQIAALGNAVEKACNGDKLNKCLGKLTSAELEAALAAKGVTPPDHLPLADLSAALDEIYGATEQLADSWGKPKGQTVSSVCTLLDAIHYGRTELTVRKRQRSLLSFDDLLHELDRALGSDPEGGLATKLRATFKAALIDEFQDTDPIQWNVFRTAFEHAGVPLFLVGDPKQAIYSFRGADVYAYLSARDDLSRPYHLGKNWRSDPSLVEALNYLYGQAPRAFVESDSISYQPVRPRDDLSDGYTGPVSAPLQLLWLPVELGSGLKDPERISSSDEPIDRLVAEAIARLLTGDARIHGQPVEPGQVAVLCRSNRQTRIIQDQLRELGIRSVLHGDTSVFDTSESEQLGRLLAAMAAPTDRRAIKAALSTPPAGYQAHQLAALAEDEAAWEEICADFAHWHELWRDRGFTQAIRAAFNELEAALRLLALPDGERRMTNFLHLFELCAEAAHRGRLGPNALVRWLSDARQTGDEGDKLPTADSAQIRLESDGDAVQLSTIHKAKGLEYDVVYCPYLCRPQGKLKGMDARIVAYHDGFERKLDVASPDLAAHIRQAKQEALAEAARVTYVALTRAKHLCVVFTAPFNGVETSPLSLLLHGAGAGSVDECTARVKALTAEQLRAELESLAAASGGLVSVRDVDPSQPPHYQQDTGEGATLVVRTTSRTGHSPHRQSSYSRLIKGHGFTPLEAAAEDEGLRADEPDEDEQERSAGAVSAATAADAGEAPPLLAGYPRGKGPGTALHKMLEEADFGSDDDLGASVARNLDRYGLGTHLAAEVTADLATALDAPIDAEVPDLSLRKLGKAARIDEMPFVLRVDEQQWLTVERLAACFEQHAAPAAAPHYATAIRDLSFANLAGYLVGDIDLVFEHEGRFYLADYKSNGLGDRGSDYGQPGLARAMWRGHYYLQYHLYAVALHHYLMARIPDYSYDPHFGGVYYFFLRGMHPAAPAGRGVFRDRPPVDLIEALSKLLVGSGTGEVAS
ncbi:MAG: exodeoxyribonuclease V subunit beta [Deltaproteobacteria bacterium]|nr:exodeoxyribonuclease V subunit beta [Deltaproteobacteria bacterium]